VSSALLALAFLVLTASCGLRARTSPPDFQLCFFYCRQTSCPGQPIPPQLAMLAAPPPIPWAPPPPPPCDTLEVGPKTLADVLGALGGLLVAVLPFL